MARSQNGKRRRILIGKCYRIPGKLYPERELVEELRHRGHHVTVAAMTNRKNPYGYAPDEVEGWAGESVRFFDTERGFMLRAVRQDLVVLSNDKQSLGVQAASRKLGRKVLKHTVGAHFDVFGRGANHYCLAGPYYEEIFQHYEGDDSHSVTGTLSMDKAFQHLEGLTDKAFRQKYGLNPDAKLALLCTKAPQSQNAAEVDTYRKILDTIKARPGWQAILKGHPNDHLKAKAEKMGGKHSWEVHSPDAIVIAPEDGYDAIRLSSLGLGTTTSISLEFSAFQVPFYHVDRIRCMLPDEDTVRAEGMASKLEAGLHHYDVPEDIRQEVIALGGKRYGKFRHDYCSVPPFPFVGGECRASELDQVLDLLTEGPELNERLQDHYEMVVQAAFHRFDGKTYFRIADEIERLLETES